MKMDNLILGEFLYFATTRCNCRCKHCNPVAYTGKSLELTSKQMIEIFEKSKYLQANSISVAGGEPFLKEDLDEFIVYLDKKKIPCIISTNGWFTEKIERLIIKLEDNKTVRFAISIDGPEEMHDEIRQRKGIYQRALKSAQVLRDAGFDVQVNMVVQKDNLNYLEEFDTFFNNNKIPVIYIPQIFVGDDEFNFTTKDIKKIFKYVDYPRGRKYLLSQGQYTISNCHAGRNSWIIDCNGDVYTCCGGYYKDNQSDFLMGNLMQNDFDTIFTSDRKETVCRNAVDNCVGCLLPRDIERETELFGFSTSYTKEEVSILQDELTNISILQDFSVDPKEWYDLEVFENDTFRWMRKKTSRIFLSSFNTNKKKLVIDYLNGKPNNNEQLILTIKVDENDIESIACNIGRNKIEVCLDKLDMLDDLLEIKLCINILWSPSDYAETLDNRELGIGIFSVSIE